MKTEFLCPVCRERLEQRGSALVCPKRHSFDISAEGYVNLAIGKSGSGDSSDMCRARRDFLSVGYYSRFADAVAEAVRDCSPTHSVCDAGCGEGYYLRRIRGLLGDGKYVGLDLAKTSVRFAAKAEKNEKYKIDYAVAGIFDMPLPSEAFGAVTSVFAPVPDAEAHRVLCSGGILVVAHPGEKHLSGLKHVLYSSPYDNVEKKLSFDGFMLTDEKRCRYSVNVKKDDAKNLLLMTPYYWKTSKEDEDRLLASDGFETELDFIVSVFKKIENQQ